MILVADMKLLHSNLKKGEVKVLTQNLDDLWYLSSIIEPKDIVQGKTLRKIKLSEAKESTKKSVFIKLEAEKVEFSKYTNVLRVSGVIKEAPEDIPLGSYHTFNVDDNTTITLIKGKWLKYQLDKLKEACSEKKSSLLICVHDREEAYFALFKKYGYEVLAHIQGECIEPGLLHHLSACRLTQARAALTPRRQTVNISRGPYSGRRRRARRGLPDRIPIRKGRPPDHRSL